MQFSIKKKLNKLRIIEIYNRQRETKMCLIKLRKKIDIVKIYIKNIYTNKPNK